MIKRFDVCSIHLFSECNMNCKFCYRAKSIHEEEKSIQWWTQLIPYLKELNIDQVAAGGGEPLMKPAWLHELARKCDENGMIFNFTTNGKLLPKDDRESLLMGLDMELALADTTMVSISYDSEKIKNYKDALDFANRVMQLKEKFPKLKIGVNYLCDDYGLEQLVSSVKFFLDDLKLDRVFALSPKNFTNNILKYRQTYQMLTMIYPKFMVDDLTKCIIENNSYNNWKHPCHFGKVLSIDECGNVGGCSFDLGKVNVLKLENPKDILQIRNIELKERHSCPYLVEGKI